MLLLACCACHGTEALVVNPKTPCDSLTRAQIKDILLGRTVLWSDGTRVQLVLSNDPALMAEVLKEYAGKTPSQFDAWWKRQIFTGTGTMPPTASSAEDLLRQVAQTPGAVAFIGTPPTDDHVKVVKIK
jgi:ABC-type phosphate transport system substrate-binding protein